MRYIGSKENLLDFIVETVAAHGIQDGVFCDLFAGTTAVGRCFKRLGYRVISNDLMEYAFVFGKAYIENDGRPAFPRLDLPAAAGAGAPPEPPSTRLGQVLAYLNGLAPEEGFIFAHYSDEGTRTAEIGRMFFSAANAGKIDAIRNTLACWRASGAIDEAEFYSLLAALLEAIPGVSNTSGTYGAFLKYWEPRARKPLTLAVPPPVPGAGGHQVRRCDANRLVREVTCDVLYLDPPYNGRQYATNYHLLETVARWDAPAVYGKSGLRPYAAEKSAYCRKETALAALQDVVDQARCRLLLLSYNGEGIMPHAAVCGILGRRGPVTVRERPYRRFRSDSDHARRRYQTATPLVERLYAVRLDGAEGAPAW